MKKKRISLVQLLLLVAGVFVLGWLVAHTGHQDTQAPIGPQQSANPVACAPPLSVTRLDPKTGGQKEYVIDWTLWATQTWVTTDTSVDFQFTPKEDPIALTDGATLESVPLPPHPDGILTIYRLKANGKEFEPVFVFRCFNDTNHIGISKDSHLSLHRRGDRQCEPPETSENSPEDCGDPITDVKMPLMFAFPVEDNCPTLDPVGWFNQDPVSKLYFCAKWSRWDTQNPLTYVTELGTYTVTYMTHPRRIIVTGPTQQIGYPLIEGGQTASGFWVDAEGAKIMGPIFFYYKDGILYVDETLKGVVRDNPNRKTPRPQG